MLPIHYSSGSMAAMFINCNLMATAYWSQVGIWSMLDQLPSLRISNWDKEIPSWAAYITVGISAAVIPGSSFISETSLDCHWFKLTWVGLFPAPQSILTKAMNKV